MYGLNSASSTRLDIRCVCLATMPRHIHRLVEMQPSASGARQWLTGNPAGSSTDWQKPLLLTRLHLAVSAAAAVLRATKIDNYPDSEFVMLSTRSTGHWDWLSARPVYIEMRCRSNRLETSPRPIIHLIHRIKPIDPRCSSITYTATHKQRRSTSNTVKQETGV